MWMVKKRLKNEGCGDLIDQACVLRTLLAGGVEDGVSLLRGEPLVPQAHREAGVFGELGGEAANAFGLSAGFSGESKG